MCAYLERRAKSLCLQLAPESALFTCGTIDNARHVVETGAELVLQTLRSVILEEERFIEMHREIDNLFQYLVDQDLDKFVLLLVTGKVGLVAQVRSRLRKCSHLEQIDEIHILNVLTARLMVEAPLEFGQIHFPVDDTKRTVFTINRRKVNRN